MDENKDFFGRVKAWCKEHKTTIKALMQDSSGGEWTEFVFYGWRKGSSLPNGENIARLARFMGVSCDYLITGEEYDPPVSDKALEVARKYDSLSAGSRLRLEDFLAGLWAADDAHKTSGAGRAVFA